MRTVYLITDEDSEIEKAAEAMADDYEVSREVMRAALENFVVYRMEQWMEKLRENADLDETFDSRFVQRAIRDWKRVNP